MPWVWLYLWKFELGIVWIHAFYLLSSRCPQNLHNIWNGKGNSTYYWSRWSIANTANPTALNIWINPAYISGPTNNNPSFSVNMYSYIINKSPQKNSPRVCTKRTLTPTPLQPSSRGSIKQHFKVYDSTRDMS